MPFLCLSTCSKMATEKFDWRQFLELSSWPNMVNLIKTDSMQLTRLSVELHKEICTVIPSIVNLLKDEDKEVRSTAVSVVGELVKHGESGYTF